MKSEVQCNREIKINIPDSSIKFLSPSKANQAIINSIYNVLIRTDPIKYFDLNTTEEIIKLHELNKTEYIDNNEIITLDLFKYELKYYNYLYRKIIKYLIKHHNFLSIFYSFEKILLYYRFLLYLESISNNTKSIISNIYKSKIYELIKFIISPKVNKTFDENYFLRSIYTLAIEFDPAMIILENIDNDLNKY